MSTEENKQTRWHIKGTFLENCNCNVVCPCTFSPNRPLTSKPTQGACEWAWGFHINSGNYSNVLLDGLNVAMFGSSPGPMAEGNWSVALYLDERANEQQRQALEAIFSGSAGGPCLGVAHLAITHDEQSGNGPDNGHECNTVHGHLDRHDSRHDVPYSSSDDPYVQQNLPKPTTAGAAFRPDLDLRQRLSARLVLVRGVAYPLAVLIEKLAAPSMWLMENAARLGGVVLLVAGLYQLSPLKDICLAKCGTPVQFILGSWRDGYGGAFRMGLEHGAYCLGCCWLLFVILFPLGLMNIAVMALLTALIYAEKALPIGRQISQLVGGGLIVYGVLVIFLPAALPMGM